MYSGSTKALGYSVVTVEHMTILQSVRKQHQWFSEQKLIFVDFQEIRLEVNYDHDIIHNTNTDPWRGIIAKIFWVNP